MKKILLIALILPLFMFAEEKTVGYLGVSTEDLSEAMKTAVGLEHGLLVTRVHKDTPAEKAGIEVGDIILKVADEKITDLQTLKKVVGERPDQKVKIVLYRSGKELTKEVKLGKRVKSTVNLNFNIPDIEELKELLNRGNEEYEEKIEELKQEIEKLKEELEKLKKELK